MRKIFTLLAGVVIGIGALNAQTVTMTWPLGNAEAPGATVTGEGAEFVTTGNVTNGAKLTLVGARAPKNDPNITGYEYMPTENYPTKADQTGAFWVEFPVTVAEGKVFTPTKVSFYGAKLGTGNDVSTNSFFYTNGTKLTVKDAISWARDESTLQNITEFPKVEAPFVGDYSLVLNVYSTKAGTKKSAWFSTVVIEGEISDAGVEDTRVPAPISWDPASVTVGLGQEFTSPVLKNEENLAVEYTSDNTSVANVDANGVITLVEGVVGTANITATYKGDTDKYKYTTVSCKVTVEFVKEIFIANKTFQISQTTPVTEGAVIFSDDNFSAVTKFANKVVETELDICGVKFSDYITVRAKLSNGELIADGENRSYLVFAPKANMEIAVYVRIQNKTSNPNFNDIKDCVLYDESLTAISANKLYFNSWSKDANSGNEYAYAYIAKTYNLEADKTYYFSAAGFGCQFFGLGYNLEAVEAPAAPEIESSAINAEGEIDYDGTAVTVTLTHADGADIYYNFTPVVTEETPAVQAAEPTVDVDGKAYTLYTDPISIEKAGELSYFARKNGVDSEIKTVKVNDLSSALTEINADANAPVEYFNLQGIRVANPENGVFIRRQGNTVTKVVK